MYRPYELQWHLAATFCWSTKDDKWTGLVPDSPWGVSKFVRVRKETVLMRKHVRLIDWERNDGTWSVRGCQCMCNIESEYKFLQGINPTRRFQAWTWLEEESELYFLFRFEESYQSRSYRCLDDCHKLLQPLHRRFERGSTYPKRGSHFELDWLHDGLPSLDKGHIIFDWYWVLQLVASVFGNCRNKTNMVQKLLDISTILVGALDTIDVTNWSWLKK